MDTFVGGLLAAAGGALVVVVQIWRDSVARRRDRANKLRDEQRERAVELIAAARTWEEKLRVMVTVTEEHLEGDEYLPSYTNYTLESNPYQVYRHMFNRYQSAVESVHLMFDDPLLLRESLTLRDRSNIIEGHMRDVVILEGDISHTDLLPRIKSNLEQHALELERFERAARMQLVGVQAGAQMASSPAVTDTYDDDNRDDDGS